MQHTLEDYRMKYGLRQRSLKLMTPTTLKYTDTGELMVLLSSMGRWDCTKLHIILNRYFKKTLGGVSIIVENLKDKCKVRAIGEVSLKEPLILQQKSSFITRSDNEGTHWVERNEIEGELCCQIEYILHKEYRQALINCLMIPYHSPKQTKILYHIILVNILNFFRCEEFYNGVVSETLRHCFGIIVSASKYEEKSKEHEDCKAMVKAYVEILSAMGTKMIYSEIQKQSLALLNASDCLLYLTDANSDLFLKSSIITSEGLSINKNENKVVTHHVKNICKPFYCANLREEPLYEHCGSEDAPRNLLSFTLNQIGREPQGLLELYGIRENISKLNPADVEKTRTLGILIALALDRHDRFEAFVSQKHKLTFTDCFLLRRSKITIFNDTVKHIMECDQPHNYHRFSDIRFDPRLVPEDHVTCVCYRIFHNMGLLKKLGVKQDKFARFLVYVKNSYNILPFHNWTQAFATFHFTFTLLNTLNLVKNKYITLLEVFALLLASLCHCLESRGSTTLFTMMCGTVQSSLFSSPGSIAQLYYATYALRLMNFQETNFLESLSDNMFCSFAKLLIGMIKDTDIDYNNKKINELDELGCNEFDFNNWNHRKLIHNIIINISQMNFIVKPWSYCRAIGENCFHEFYRKGDLSHASDVYETTELSEDILKLPALNMHFIDKVGLPTFRVFVKMFPVMTQCIRKIEANRKNWESEKEKILTDMTKEALGGGGAEGDEIVLINPFIKNE